MKNKIYRTLTKPPVVVVTMLIAAFLSCFDRNYGYFYGIGIAFMILWSGNFRWSEFGFRKSISKKTVFSGLILAVLIFIGIDILIQPFLEIYLGAIDLTSVDDIRDDFINYIILIIIMWIFAAFGEEFLFRGYYMKWLARMFGNTDKTWLVSAFIVSIYFGVSHYYQGPAGMIAVGLAGFCFSMIFYKNRNDLAIAVLAHGFYDMIGLTFIYFNKERMFVDWVQTAL